MKGLRPLLEVGRCNISETIFEVSSKQWICSFLYSVNFSLGQMTTLIDSMSNSVL